MSDTYSKHADICVKFYELTLDSNLVGSFVFSKSRAKAGQKALFVGGMFEVARFLSGQGLHLTVVDYTDEMVEIGRKALPEIVVNKADLTHLPFMNEFDYIFVIGRVYTHMISDQELVSALNSCHRALKEGGRLFFDNYEDSKIQVTNYFNGEISCSGLDVEILRSSTTTLVSKKPFVVKWRAIYSGVYGGQGFEFSDSMEHRAWSRAEIKTFLDRTGLNVLELGDNFDETSFYVLAERQTLTKGTV